MKTDQELIEGREIIEKYKRENPSSDYSNDKILAEDMLNRYGAIFVLSSRHMTKSEKNMDDIIDGILSGTSLVHTFAGHTCNAFNEGGHNPHNQLVYHSAKAVTATLEVLGYYALAKSGHNGALIVLSATNGLSVLRNIMRFAVNSGY